VFTNNRLLEYFHTRNFNEKILSDCNTKNIFIYVEQQYIKDFLKDIKTFNTNNSYKNVTVIGRLDNALFGFNNGLYSIFIPKMDIFKDSYSIDYNDKDEGVYIKKMNGLDYEYRILKNQVSVDDSALVNQKMYNALFKKFDIQESKEIGEFCDFDVNNDKIKILEITNEPHAFQNTKSIKYEYTTTINKEMFNSCKSEILFVVFSMNSPETLEKFKCILEDVKSIRYKNVVIFNHIYNDEIIHNYQNFKKIINYNYNLNNSGYYNVNGTRIRESSDYNQSVTSLYTYRIKSLDGRPAKNLIDEPFYKYIMEVPICASSRLTQSTGTCWCNSVINSIILVPYIRTKIVKYIKGHSLYEKIKDLDYRYIKSSNDFQTALFILFNNLLIKQDKAQPENGNFVADIAARLKSIVQTRSEKYYKNLRKEDYTEALKYGDGGSPFVTYESVKYILKMFTEISNLNLYDVLEEYKKTDKYLELNKPYSDNLKIAKNNMQNCIKTSCPDIYYLSDILENTPRKIPDEKIELNTQYYTIEKLTDILVINTDFDNSDQCRIKLYNEIYANNIKYKLQSSVISTGNFTHAIAGLVCNDVPYIFDSNNILAFDDWINYDSKNYTYKTKGKYFGEFKIDCISYLIYIKA
jgi:hypothetical protein